MSQKGLAPIVIVLLIALGIGGYLIYSNKINIPQERTEQTAPVVDETADWKTYISQKNEFSFKYPTDWYFEVVPQYQDGPAVSFVNEEDIRFFKIGDKAKKTAMMAKGEEQLIVTLNNSQQNFDQLRQGLNLDTSPTVFDGKQALRYATGIYILLDPDLNRILSVYRPQYPDEGYLDKILSTFKFTK